MERFRDGPPRRLGALTSGDSYMGASGQGAAELETAMVAYGREYYLNGPRDVEFPESGGRCK